MPYIDEYLVKLGFVEDMSQYRRFQRQLEDANRTVGSVFGEMGETVAKIQSGIVGGFGAVAAAALGVVDKVAMADQEYRLFGLRMYMTKDAARSLKIAMDALGQPLENLAWDPELRARAGQLFQDQARLGAGLGVDFDQEMRKIRDIRFEFTRMKVEAQYAAMSVVENFMKALGMGPDDLLAKLRKFNEWIITDLPQLSQEFVRYFMPIWHDIERVGKATGEALKEAAVLFTNLIGLFSGDTSIEGTTFSFEKLAAAVEHVSGGFADFAELIAHTETMLADLVNALTLLASGKFKEAGQAFKKAAYDVSTKEAMELMGGGFGLAFGGLPGAAAGTAAMYEFGSALERTIGTPAPTAPGPATGLATATTWNDLFRAMVGQESGGNQSAVSRAGAIGMMQLMPGTAKELGVDPNDPAQNVEGGQRYMRMMMARYHNNLPDALAAYNAGPGRIDQVLAGKASLPEETSNYVASILGKLGQRGDVTIGSITVHVKEPHATPSEIAHATKQGVIEASQGETLRNLQQFNGDAWSY